MQERVLVDFGVGLSSELDVEDIKTFPLESQEKMEDVYSAAYQLYRQKLYQKASHFFRILVLMNSKQSKFWKGLGASLQMMHQYEEAISCYTTILTLANDEIDSYLYVNIADCYFALKETSQGLNALEKARLSAEKKRDLRVLHHVAFMKKLWSNPNK